MSVHLCVCLSHLLTAAAEDIYRLLPGAGRPAAAAPQQHWAAAANAGSAMLTANVGSRT